MQQIRCNKRATLSFFVLLFIPLLCIAENTENLLEHASKTGCTVYWDTLSGIGLLEKNGHQVSFRISENVALMDNKKIIIVDAPSLHKNCLYVSKDFITHMDGFFKVDSDTPMFRIGAIIVDPGHGGKDPGAMEEQMIGGKKVTVKEKDITLSIGKMLYAKLKSGYPDKNILMTRDSDVFMTLSQRTEIANSVILKKHEAIIYISIHVNASLDKKAAGYEVWYLSPEYRRTVLDDESEVDETLGPILNSMMEEEYTTESIIIAKFIMDSLQAQVSPLSAARGIKAEEWFVVRNVNMPSVLVETGFLTNAREAALLCDAEYLKKITLGIYNGLSAFVTHFERSRGFTGTK